MKRSSSALAVLVVLLAGVAVAEVSSIASVDIYTQPVKDWVAYDGRLQSRILRRDHPAEPAIRKESESLLLVMNTKKTDTNGLLVVWSKTAGTNYVCDADLTVYAGSGKMKNENPVAAKNAVSLNLDVNGISSSALLGTSTWAGKYNAAGDVIREKLSVSFSGQTLKRFSSGGAGEMPFQIRPLHPIQKGTVLQACVTIRA